jgi:hypothetical protein
LLIAAVLENGPALFHGHWDFVPRTGILRFLWRLVMSIDNFIWVPIGARYTGDGGDTKYKSDLGSASNYTQHQVSVTHGTNVLIDERYLFQDEMDARWFWEEGYKERLFRAGSDGVTDGYERMTLWLNGKLQAERNKAVSSD